MAVGWSGLVAKSPDPCNRTSSGPSEYLVSQPQGTHMRDPPTKVREGTF